MAQSERCIIPPPETRFIPIREEYLGICAKFKHRECAAAILGVFEHWTRFKLDDVYAGMEKRRLAREAGEKPPRMRVSLWIWMPQDRLRLEELFGLWGETVVSKALTEVLDSGFLRRRRNPDPDYKWDKTFQYLFVIPQVQAAVFKWANSPQAGNRIFTASKRLKYGFDGVDSRRRSRKNKAAIPQSPSQSRKQNRKQESGAAGAPSPDDHLALAALIKAWLDALKGKPAGDPYNNKTIRACALELHRDGVTPPYITDYVEHLKKDKFWKGKLIEFYYVANNIRIYLFEIRGIKLGQSAAAAKPAAPTTQLTPEQEAERDAEFLRDLEEMKRGQQAG